MISIFVSSTFRDMQAERDALSLDVLPEINAKAQENFDAVSFVDLRWGVDTSEIESEAGAAKVLSVCLDEIEHCHPYMIIILGERYGWIPEAALLNRTAGQHDYVPADDRMSVTALEIEYGALSERGQLERCLFYMRESLDLDGIPEAERAVYLPESPEHQAKLEALKNKIESQTRKPIRRYKATINPETKIPDVSEFTRMVTEDLNMLLEKEWEKAKTMNWQEKEAAAARLFLEEKSAQCAGREELCESYKNMLLSPDLSLLVVKGASGSGKSTITGKLFTELEREGINTIPVAVRTGYQSSDTHAILERLIYDVQQLIGENQEEASPEEMREGEAQQDLAALTMKNLKEKLDEQLTRYQETADKPLVILLDGAEAITGTDKTNFAWLPAVLPERVKVFACMIASDATVIPLDMGSFAKEEKLPEMDEEQREAVIRGILNQSKKQLSEPLLEKIAEKTKGSLPLYIALFIHRLVMLDSDDFKAINEAGGDMEAINTYLSGVIDNLPEKPGELAAVILDEAAERINKPLCRKFADLLSKPGKGLREEDAKNLLERNQIPFNSLDFSRLMKYLHIFFERTADGRIRYSHALIKTGIYNSVPKADLYPNAVMTLSYLDSLPYGDIVKRDELVNSAWSVTKYDYLVTYIAELYRTERRGDLSVAMQQLAKLVVSKVGMEKEEFWDLFRHADQTETGRAFAKAIAVNIGTCFGQTKDTQQVVKRLYAAIKPAVDAEYKSGKMMTQEYSTYIDAYAQAHRYCGEFGAAINTYGEFAKISEELPGEQTPELQREVEDVLAEFDRQSAILCELMGEYTAMAGYASRAEKIQRKLAESGIWHDRYRLANSLEMLAEAQRKTGDLKEAKENSFGAIEIRKSRAETNGAAKDHRNLAISYESYSKACTALGEFEEALQYAQLALEESKEAAKQIRTDSMARELAIAYQNLATAEALLDLYADAEMHHKEAEYRFAALQKKKKSIQSEKDLHTTKEAMMEFHFLAGQIEEGLRKSAEAKELALSLKAKEQTTTYDFYLQRIENFQSMTPKEIAEAMKTAAEQNKMPGASLQGMAMEYVWRDAKTPEALEKNLKKAIRLAKKMIEISDCEETRAACAAVLMAAAMEIRKRNVQLEELSYACRMDAYGILEDLIKTTKNKEKKKLYKKEVKVIRFLT